MPSPHYTTAYWRYADIYDSRDETGAHRPLTDAEQTFLTTYSAISANCARVQNALWRDGLRGDEYYAAARVAYGTRDVEHARALLALDEDADALEAEAA